VVFLTATDVLDLYGFDRRPELRKICRYIQRTDKGRLSKDMYSDDLRALYLLGEESVCESIILSFYFGQAKGYRACEQKKG
jgi:hypothetical protein